MIKQLFRRKTVSGILKELDNTANQQQLHKNLSLRDLTFFGIAAIVGAGIFSTIGEASASGGPAISLLFLFTAIACGFSAMCYAEFASTIPISGSAYTYAYVAFGELIAWIIGWTLIMEYSIGNIAVAISWSDYFTGLFNNSFVELGIKIPAWMSMDYLSASRGFEEVTTLLAQGKPLNEMLHNQQEAYRAWTLAPSIGGLRLVLDIPALGIVAAITALVYVGISESKKTSNAFVILKLSVVILVIIVGAYYVNVENWTPFAPNGIKGVLGGVSAVFFAYIGFDAISTTAEECKNPKVDLPRSMMLSLIICTILYIAVTLVITGLIPYYKLGVGDPLAFVFEQKGITWMSKIVAVSAVIAIASVLLVFQMGQPRIWMSMSRDGLLPKKFSKIHPRFKTPSFATIITGLLVSIPALFMNLKEVTDLTSIGTLFAFVLVCGGVIRMESHKMEVKPKFRVPYFNARYVAPTLYAIAWFIALWKYPSEVQNFFTLSEVNPEQSTALSVFLHQFPLFSFLILATWITLRSMTHQLSLIPVLGLVVNFYLMTELGVSNWIGFGIWLLAGLLIYFGFGFKNSRLAKEHTK